VLINARNAIGKPRLHGQVDPFLSPERKAKCPEKRERDLFALFDVAKMREMRD